MDTDIFIVYITEDLYVYITKGLKQDFIFQIFNKIITQRINEKKLLD